MAGSSSDSSELRNYLKDLRSRTGGRVSPSRIPRPDLAHETDHEGQKPVTNRAAALLDRVANLGRRKEVRSKPTEESSPTTSLTISSSKKEVAFDLTSDKDRRDQSRSRIPRSPKSAQRKNEPQLKETKKTPSPKRIVPDVNRHQARRSPSPYHKNCQHSHLSTPNSPEPERGASPKMSRVAATKSKPSSPRVTSAKISDRQPGRTTTEKERSDPPELSRAESLGAEESELVDTSKSKSGAMRKSESSTTRTSASTGTKTSASSQTEVSRTSRMGNSENSEGTQTLGPTSKSDRRNPDSTSRRDSSNQRTSAEYSDTFEETTSKLRSSSSRRHARSRSLDTGLRRSSRSSNVMSSRSSKRSKSSTVPDWWFPGILPPKHLGGDHLEQLQQLHLGVLDDLFRFQMGLIEKHQQRSETRYKWMNEFVKLNHSYTTWEDYQRDPRARFFSWQKHAATADLPFESH